jgi:hypothetical protein
MGHISQWNNNGYIVIMDDYPRLGLLAEKGELEPQNLTPF